MARAGARQAGEVAEQFGRVGFDVELEQDVRRNVLPHPAVVFLPLRAPTRRHPAGIGRAEAQLPVPVHRAAQTPRLVGHDARDPVLDGAGVEG